MSSISNTIIFVFFQDDAEKGEPLQEEEDDGPRELADFIHKISSKEQNDNSCGMDFSFISRVVHLVQGLLLPGEAGVNLKFLTLEVKGAGKKPVLSQPTIGNICVLCRSAFRI